MKNADYRPDIDGLRAMAVSAVLVFHAFPNLLPGGFVGVDVFFVISGFLITGIILKGLREDRFSFGQFYARRVRRIFPALALVISACLAAGWFLLLPDEFAQLGKHAAGGATFSSNIMLWQESGYFEESASRTVLLHVWSLGIEEQFYLAWPVLLVIGWKLRLPASWVIGAVLLGSFALNMWSIGSDPVATFYSPFTRAWELAVGALLASLSGRFQPTRAVSKALSIGGIGLILVSAVWFSEAVPFPGWRAALPTIGAAAIIAAGPTANRLLAMRLPVAVGKISYPLYLWHWPLLAFPMIVMDGQVPAAVRALALFVAFLLAAATYAFLEWPLRGDNSLMSKAATLAASVALVGVLGLSIHTAHGMPWRPAMAGYVEARAWLNESLDWNYAENNTCLDRFPSPDRREGWWFCVLERDAPPTVFLMGNSFANHLYPGIVEQSAFSQENVLQFGSCDPGMGLSFTYPPAHPCFGEARQRQEAMVSRIVEENPTIRLAILSAPWPSFDEKGDAVDYFDPTIVEGQYRSVPAVAGETSYDAYMGALERRIAFLADRGVATAVVLMSPELGYDPRSCYSGRPLRPSENSCQVSYATELAKQSRFRDGLREIADRYPSLEVFDPLQVLCSGDVCNMKGTEGPLLRDVGHLSVEGSRKVAAAFAAWRATL